MEKCETSFGIVRFVKSEVRSLFYVFKIFASIIILIVFRIHRNNLKNLLKRILNQQQNY